MTDAHPLPTTRYAQPADVPRLLEMARLHALEMPHGKPSDRRLLQSIDWVLGSGRIIVSVADDGEVVGMLSVVAQQPLWSEDWQLDEINFFVMPEHRRHRHAQALLNAAKRLAADLGIPLIPGAFGKRALGKARLMQRTLGEPVGYMFAWYPPGYEGAR